MTNVLSPTLQMESEPQIAPNASALTVLFAELSGSTLDVTARADSYVRQAMGRHELMASEIIQKRAGRVVKAMDGSVMADFPGPAFAVRAAIEMERAWVEFNQSLPLEQQLDLRIGIHACEGERVAINLFGDSVSVAAAITKLAGPGQVLVSRSVHEAIASESDLHSHWFSQIAVAGRAERQDIFEANWADAPTNIPARYNVLSQVGKGGIGVVYKVRDLETGETIALKVLKSGIAADPAMQESLRREVCLARKVTHKNVCRIHDFNRANGTASISMEFVEGESLLARLQRLGVFSWSEALQITVQICAGLREAHAQGIVHRDLKPANIMVDKNGTVKIMDFGIARLFQTDSQLTGSMVGTPAYMAPEQVELKPVDARTDIYALGLLLYEMVTAAPAFAGETPVAMALKQLREFPQRPREIVPSLPAFAEAVILKCIQKDPAKRFASVDELQMAMEQKPKVRRVRAVRPGIAPELLRTARQIEGLLRSALAQADAFLRRQDWSVLRTKRVQQVAAVTLGSAVILAAGLALVHAKNRASSKSSPEASATTSSPSWPELPSPPAAGANTDVVRMESVSIFKPAAVANDANSEIAPRAAKADAAPVKAPVTRKVPVAHTESAQRKAAGLPLTGPRPVPTTPTPSASATLVAAEGSASNQSAEEAHPALSAAVATAAVPEDSLAGKAAGTDESDVSGHAAPSMFIEVGSFKDAAWAENAVDKLNALGFHAVSVHKTVLWMQSYHVQVGPYASAKEAETARQSLVQQGLKPHVVK